MRVKVLLTKIAIGIGWAASVFLFLMGVFGMISGDVVAGFGVITMGLALLPKFQKIGSLTMNPWMRAGVFILGFIFVGVGASSANKLSKLEEQAPSEVIEEQEVSSIDTTLSSSTSSADLPASDRAKVVRVIDGDTVVIQTNEGSEEHVRIVGINAPEKGECFTNEATQRLANLVQGKAVVLEAGSPDKRDSFGRLLYYLRLGDVDIGAKLIQEGFVLSFPKYLHPRSQIYNDFQETAKIEEKGLWVTCKAQEQVAPKPSLVVPIEKPTESVPAASSSISNSDSSVSAQEQQTSPASQECVIKGNVNSKHEKIYHFPGCKSYSITKVQPDEGDRWFCSEPEAQTAGFRKAGNCP